MKRILLVLLLALGVLGAEAAAPYVYLLRGDTSHIVGQNSCVLGDNWSDGKAPQADRDYLVDLGDAGSLFAVGATAQLTFPGRSLTLGNAETGAFGRLLIENCMPLTVNDIRTADGAAMRQYGASWWSRLSCPNITMAPASVLNVELDTADLYWQTQLNGDAASELRIHLANGSFSAPAARMLRADRFSEDSGKFARVLTNFYGRVLVEGTNVWYCGHNHGFGCVIPSSTLGADTGAFVPDAILLRYGGGFRFETGHGCHFKAGNRGVTVGTGGGRWHFATGNGIRTAIKVNFTGEGDLTYTSSGTHFDSTIDCAVFRVGNGGTFRMHDNLVWSDRTELEVSSNGTFYTWSKDFRPCRTVLHSGATICAGVAHGGRYINNGSDIQFYRPSGCTVGTLILTTDSEIDLSGGPIKLQIESESFGGFYRGRVPILKVPFAVAELHASDFTARRTPAYNPESVRTEGTIDRTVEIDIEGDIQTVYLVTPGQAYVVPAGTAGNVPTAPYDTWAKAANNLATAAAACPVGTITLAPGTYPLTETISVGQRRICSADASGKICPTRVIIDGGGKESDMSVGIRPFILTATQSCLDGLTIRNGYTSGYGGGVLASSNGDILNCIIDHCYATNATQTSCGGGGVGAPGTKPRICRTTIKNCIANANGGGIYIQATDASQTEFPSRESSCLVSACEILDNFAAIRKGSVSGGGVGIMHWPRVWLESTHFSGNGVLRDQAGSSENLGPQIAGLGKTTVTNCVFENTGPGSRAIASGTDSTRFIECVFRNNTNGNLMNGGSYDRCVFTNNTTEPIYFQSGPFLRNCLYANNEMYLHARNAKFENCTIVSNRTGGVYTEHEFAQFKYNPVFVNTIIADNLPNSNRNWDGCPNWYVSYQGDIENVTVSNCCIRGAAGLITRQGVSIDPIAKDLTGCSFDADPRFKDSSALNWRLNFRSPCRDTAQMLGWMTPEALDLDKRPRRLNRNGKYRSDAVPDLGCYECAEAMPGFIAVFR